MPIAKLYKATIPSINYIFRNGKPAIFVRGKFATDIASEIAELDEEIANAHPYLFVDTDEPTAETATGDLIAGLRATLEAEIRAEMAAASALTNDMGTSEQTKLVPSSTVDIAVAAAGNGAADSTAAKLVNLKVGK